MFQAGEAACIKTFWTQLHRSGIQGQPGTSAWARVAGSSAAEVVEGCCLWLAQGDGEPAKWAEILWCPWREAGAGENR